MKIFLNCICFAVVLVIVALLVWAVSSRADGAENPVQTYTPGRYILLAAELNVSSLQTTVPNTRKVVLQADTRTGQCWVLELMVPGAGNFQVTSAAWRAVAPPQAFQNGN